MLPIDPLPAGWLLTQTGLGPLDTDMAAAALILAAVVRPHRRAFDDAAMETV